LKTLRAVLFQCLCQMNPRHQFVMSVCLCIVYCRLLSVTCLVV